MTKSVPFQAIPLMCSLVVLSVWRNRSQPFLFTMTSFLKSTCLIRLIPWGALPAPRSLNLSLMFRLHLAIDRFLKRNIGLILYPIALNVKYPGTGLRLGKKVLELEKLNCFGDPTTNRGETGEKRHSFGTKSYYEAGWNRPKKGSCIR